MKTTMTLVGSLLVSAFLWPSPVGATSPKVSTPPEVNSTAELTSLTASPLPPVTELSPCPPRSVLSGSLCVDKYESSVWAISSSQQDLIDKVKKGTVTLSDLTAGGAVQKGIAGDDYGGQFGLGCQDNGNGCTSIYAVSLPGVSPSAYISWPQAAAACRNAGKRLLTNAEWQVTAFGTPRARDLNNPNSPCRPLINDIGLTGTPGCTSDVNAYDMEGNVWEWIADWQPDTFAYVTNCGDQGPGNASCLSRSPAFWHPQPTFRGGNFRGELPDPSFVLALGGSDTPLVGSPAIGLRCGR